MKRILFLGQAPARPSSKHDIPGTYLHKWLQGKGFTDQDILNYCHFYALIAEFPGATKHGHLTPKRAQIELHRPILIKAIQDIHPEIIVPVGRMAINELLQKDAPLEERVGAKFEVDPFNSLRKRILCIPLSHPSGRSIWNQTHKIHVQQALELLRKAVF